MNPFHTSTTSDLAFWSYVSPQEGDQSTMWSETAGHVRSALEFDYSILGCPVTDFNWDTAAFAFEKLPYHDLENLSGTQPDFIAAWLTPTPTLTDVDPVTSSARGDLTRPTPSPVRLEAASQRECESHRCESSADLDLDTSVGCGHHLSNGVGLAL
ncbi:hypothetical protein BJV74DRAFT_513067 [Russula compacta]|nr:hypothetical protein BJV74DRAFT_513067 [Russula compacta]